MTTYKDLSATAKRRMKLMAVCPLCGNSISDTDCIEYITFPNGKWKSYVFFHTNCLREFVKEGQHAEEQT